MYNFNFGRAIPLFFLSFILVDFFFYQVQLFSIGSAIVSNAAFKLLVVVYFFFILSSNPARLKLDHLRLKSFSLIAVVIFFCLSVFNSLRFGYSSGYALQSFVSYDIYVYIFLFSLFTLGPPLSDKAFSKFILVISITIFSGAILQLLIGVEPFMTADEDRSINSIGFFDRQRIFSFFSSAMVFGMCLTYISFYYFCKNLEANNSFLKRVFFFILLFFTCYLVYETYTRNVYIYFACCFAVFIILLKKRRVPSYFIYLPYLLLVLLLLGVFFIMPLVAMTGDSGFSLFYSDTAQLRFLNWSMIINDIMSKPVDLIFGTGLVQHGSNSYKKGLLIDNTFLAVLYQHGLVGLILLLILMHQIWLKLCSKTELCFKSKWMLVVISPFLVTGFFNTTYYFFLLYAAIYFLTFGVDNNENTH